MPKPNDSIAITAGTGTTVATHTVSSKEYQAIMIADAAGYLIDDPTDCFASCGLAMAKAASRNYLTLFNNDDASGRVVDVLGVWLGQELTAAVTGLVRGYRLYRSNTTTPSGGTLNTPVKLDTGSGALDADVEVRVSSGSGVTATVSGEAIAAIGIAEEETGGGGSSRIWLWNWKEIGMSLVLRPDEGIIVQQDSTAGTGLISVGVVFRIRN